MDLEFFELVTSPCVVTWYRVKFIKRLSSNLLFKAAEISSEVAVEEPVAFMALYVNVTFHEAGGGVSCWTVVSTVEPVKGEPLSARDAIAAIISETVPKSRIFIG